MKNYKTITNEEQFTDKPSNYRSPAECWGARHSMTAMSFMGMAIIFMLRCSFSLVIVAMVKDGEFAWDEATQGLLLGCFHYGSLATNFLGGRLAEHVGGTKVAGTGVLVSSVIAILSPLCVRVSTGLFVAVRILQGAAVGVLIPSINVILASWVPAVEKANISTIVYSGIDIGIILSMLLGGWLCDTEVLGGWPLVFYVFGGLGILWTLIWFLLVRDRPDIHPTISQEEKNYILAQGGIRKGEVMPIPWISLLTSLPLWSVVLAHFGHNWGSVTFLTELPTYLKNVHHFDMKSNGFFSALPFLSMWVFSLVYSNSVDFLLSRDKISTIFVRWISTAIGIYGRVAGLIALCFVSTSKVPAIVTICMSVSFGGTVYCGFMCSLQDLAPNLAGTLMGISITIATIPNFVAPMVIGFILRGNQTQEAWRTVFIISASVCVATGSMYVVFVTDKEQPWNNAETKKTDK